MIVRVSLRGELAGAGALIDKAGAIRDDVRAIATSISPDLHVEKVKVLVSELTTEQHALLGEDLDELIVEGSSDRGLAAAIEEDLGRCRFMAKRALGEWES